MTTAPFDEDDSATPNIFILKLMNSVVTFTRTTDLEYMAVVHIGQVRYRVPNPVPRKMLRLWARKLIDFTGGDDGF